MSLVSRKWTASVHYTPPLVGWRHLPRGFWRMPRLYYRNNKKQDHSWQTIQVGILLDSRLYFTFSVGFVCFRVICAYRYGLFYKTDNLKVHLVLRVLWCREHRAVGNWWRHDMILLKLWDFFDCSEQPIWKKSLGKHWLFSSLSSWDMGCWSSNCFILNSLI